MGVFTKYTGEEKMKIKDKRFKIKEIGRAIGLRVCLVCNRDLEDKHKIPLCKRCRAKYLNEDSKNVQEVKDE